MMIELEPIFASELSQMVFVYASAALFVASLAAVTWLLRPKNTEIVGVPVRA